MADSLLSQAIAEAKQVRAAALANARLQLEEAFQQKLVSDISSQLNGLDEQTTLDSSTIGTGDNKKPSASAHDSSHIDNPDQEVEAMGDGYSKPAEVKGGGDAVTENIEEDIAFEGDDEFGGEEEGLDLSAITVEELIDMLKAELAGGVDAGLGAEGGEDVPVDAMGDEDVEEGYVSEADLDGMMSEMDLQEDSGYDQNAPETREDIHPFGDKGPQIRGNTHESVDLDEVAYVMEALNSENSELKTALAEYRNVVTELRGQLNEINMLNTKLLYTNKLFKEYQLTNEQKANIVESFDYAHSIREVKMLFTTLAESFKRSGNRSKVVTESIASNVVGSTKPKSVINENSDSEVNPMVARLQQIAGIRKS